jgi:uncharacterized protein YacL
MIAHILLVVGCLVLGAAIAVANDLAPAAGLLPAWAVGALAGAVSGGVLSAAILFAWRRTTRETAECSRVARVQNGFLFGAAGAACGFALRSALGSLFPPSDGLRIAQGLLMGGCTLCALAAGAAMTTSLWTRPMRDERKPKEGSPAQGTRKVLDTSVIIDGRVGDLLATRFIEGEILIPEFVLDELQGIADSADALRRKKGRRGLEILRQLMENSHVAIRVVARDYPTIAEVDRKLIRLAKEEDATLITTDYNLNRVAQVEGIPILNVNELASALKPRFVPGEPIEVEIIDRGAEINQGVGYLDDGTMIVVENGRRHVGRTIKATVKSTLQTDAGRMLFAEPANEAPRWDKEREAR